MFSLFSDENGTHTAPTSYSSADNEPRVYTWRFCAHWIRYIHIEQQTGAKCIRRSLFLSFYRFFSLYNKTLGSGISDPNFQTKGQTTCCCSDTHSVPHPLDGVFENEKKSAHKVPQNALNSASVELYGCIMWHIIVQYNIIYSTFFVKNIYNTSLEKKNQRLFYSSECSNAHNKSTLHIIMYANSSQTTRILLSEFAYKI